MRGLAFLVLLACSGLALADQNNAFEQGKGFGEGKNQGLFSSINSGNVQDKIPAYGTTPAETQYFQGGRGETIGPGTNKMLNCATASPDPDPIKRQECEAINFLARNPQVRPQFNIGYNDPMVAKAREIGRNAESFFQSFGMSMGTSTQCTTKTETTPAQYTTETCSNIREFDGQQCTIGRVVKIDADSNFQCDQSINAYQTQTCNKQVIVNVTTNYRCSTNGATYNDIQSCLNACSSGLPSHRFAIAAGCGIYWSIMDCDQPDNWNSTCRFLRLDRYPAPPVGCNYFQSYINQAYNVKGNIRISSSSCGTSYPRSYLCRGSPSGTCSATYSYNTSIDNGCSALEARAQ